MRRTALLCLPAALMLSSCGSNAAPGDASSTSSAPISSSEAAFTTTAAPTTEDPLVADQALVRTLYYDYSQASLAGIDSVNRFIAEANHPDYVYTVEECQAAAAYYGQTDSYRLNAIPDVNAMALDPGWALPGEDQYGGLVPSGRVYILPVQFNESDPNTGLDQDETAQVHVAIIDSAAFFFVPCETPE